MDDLIPGLLILLSLAVAGLAVFLGAFCGVSILASMIARIIWPQSSPKLIAVLSSAILPMLSVLLFLLVISAALEPDFRGPEVIAIAIVGIVAAFSVILGWPLSYFVTQRVIRDR